MDKFVIRKYMIVIAAVGTFLAVFTAVRAEEGMTEESVQTYEEEVQTEESVIETSVPDDEEFIDVTEETSCSSECTDETSFSSESTDETSYETECIESLYDTYVTETITESEETLPSETEELPVYDVESTVIEGWYIPSFNYNDNGTITYFLPDGTAFYNVEMNDLELPTFAWQYTGLQGYADHLYGSVNVMNEDEAASYEAATEIILSGQEV